MMNSRDVARFLLKKDGTCRYSNVHMLGDNQTTVKLDIDRKEDSNSIPFYGIP